MFAPFCQAGLRNGEPTVARLPAHNAELLRAALDDPEGLVVLPREEQYPHPPGALDAALDVIARHADPKRRMRLLGELPAFVGLSGNGWLRYEALVNRALRELPISALCAYHTSTMPEAVRADVLRAHQVVATGNGSDAPNQAHEAPEGILTSQTSAERDPMEDGPTDIDLTDPDPSQAREAVAALARSARIDAATANDLLFCVNEVVTNAILHGLRPVVVRAWGRPRRVVVAVTDAGKGPDDPFVGLQVADPEAGEGGRGLWLVHQWCPETALSLDAGGFTVRLAGGSLDR